jgi:putative tryptophan/tyrosine transport system substrate-binding protein
MPASMKAPQAALSGVDLDEQLEAKRFELLMEFVPQARRIAYLGLREEWDRLYIRNVRAAAEQRGVDMVHVDSGHGDFASACERLRVEQPNAVMVERSPRAYGRRREIGQLALASGLATSCSQGELVEEGCLMSYGTDNVDWGRRISVYVDKILKGAKPGDLPIEAPTKFELMINAKTAAKLGITIPQSIRLRADRVIE